MNIIPVIIEAILTAIIICLIGAALTYPLWRKQER